jgi:hypothetical protein
MTSTFTEPSRLAHSGGLLSDKVRQSRRISDRQNLPSSAKVKNQEFRTKTTPRIEKSFFVAEFRSRIVPMIQQEELFRSRRGPP